MNLLVTEERYWALFYMPLYTFLHSLLNVLVQIANKMGLQNENNNTCSVSSSPNQHIRNTGTQTVIMAPTNLKELDFPEPYQTLKIH
jgi:hypothetical protein